MILGAAVVDDILGLVLLTVISAIAAREKLTVLGDRRREQLAETAAP